MFIATTAATTLSDPQMPFLLQPQRSIHGDMHGVADMHETWRYARDTAAFGACKHQFPKLVSGTPECRNPRPQTALQGRRNQAAAY